MGYSFTEYMGARVIVNDVDLKVDDPQSAVTFYLYMRRKGENGKFRAFSARARVCEPSFVLGLRTGSECAPTAVRTEEFVYAYASLVQPSYAAGPKPDALELTSDQRYDGLEVVAYRDLPIRPMEDVLEEASAPKEYLVVPVARNTSVPHDFSLTLGGPALGGIQ